MTTQQLTTQIQQKKSFLCIGLDVDLTKIPQHLLELEDPIFEFNKAIIDTTHDMVVSYKPNTAFYEAYGIKGWQSLQKTINYINEKYPEIFTIADAGREMRREEFSASASVSPMEYSSLFCVMIKLNPREG